MKLTTCGNCGNVYHDMNPGNDSIEYPMELMYLFGIDELPCIPLLDGEGRFEQDGYGCQKCHTDSYLQDNVNPNCGGMAKKIHDHLSANQKQEFIDVSLEFMDEIWNIETEKEHLNQFTNFDDAERHCRENNYRIIKIIENND